jgi:hypothetical protein
MSMGPTNCQKNSHRQPRRDGSARAPAPAPLDDRAEFDLRGVRSVIPAASFSGVFCSVNSERTQNGHIRNDTRDVWRRIARASDGGICRRKCVTHDRACTRVPLPNFHGKEGVGGSSPPEGSAKAL